LLTVNVKVTDTLDLLFSLGYGVAATSLVESREPDLEFVYDALLLYPNLRGGVCRIGHESCCLRHRRAFFLASKKSKL
jgi:hypothetical protein